MSKLQDIVVKEMKVKQQIDSEKEAPGVIRAAGWSCWLCVFQTASHFLSGL